MMLRLLAPLTPLYAAGLGAKNLAYARGWTEPKRLRWPVISVGNLSVGGAGKTPVVIRLAELLQQQGAHVDVLSRGYGRSSQATERVEPGGSAQRFGDEPLLIASSTGASVYVGASRYEAGQLAEREAALRDGQTGAHLLDDGFQHRQLARELDIVVLHGSDFRAWLLPAGRLREPLEALRRAQVLVLRVEDRALEAELRRRHLQQPLWLVRREVEIPACGRAVAFCGIARPEEFFRSLRAKGVELAASLPFRDHRAFTAADLEKLVRLQREQRADAFLTTEKDWVRLTPEQRSQLGEVARLETVRLTVRFEDEPVVRARLGEILMRK
jgi:tetraacyldisaccharide 4'-kinase